MSKAVRHHSVQRPVFALSAQVGGADADVICGDLLLDFKATSTTSIVGRGELWQLVGYALADADNQFGIRQVGVAALRWRRRWPIDIDEPRPPERVPAGRQVPYP